MAQGSVTVFEEFLENMVDGNDTTNGINLKDDTFNLVLVTDDIDTITAGTASPDVSDFTEVAAGGGYSTGGATATITATEAAGTLTIAISGTVTWTSTGSGGAATIRSAILHSTTHIGTSDAVCAIDMTSDSGTTPLDLDDGDINVSGTLFTIS